MLYETPMAAAFKRAAAEAAVRRNPTRSAKQGVESVQKATRYGAGVIPISDTTKGAGGVLVRQFYHQGMM
jgi:hypothetical protein